MGENGADMNRRRYLAGAISTGTLALAGCTGFGNDLYEGEASEYILSHNDIGRVLGENFAADSRVLDNQEGVDSGEMYEVWRGSLSGYALIVCESLEDAESWYQSIEADMEEAGGGGDELNIGDEAIYDAVQGARLLGVRLGNIVIQMNGRADFDEMEDLSELQIERIEEAG